MSSDIINGKYRDSSIELLRILAIFFILISHYSSHGSIDKIFLEFGFNKIILIISVLGNLGVDIFIIITGYFLIKSKFKLSRLIQLLLQVFFYSSIIYLVFVFFGATSFSMKGIIKAFFPTIFKEYWFFTAYVSLYLIYPYINKMLLSMNKKVYIKYLFTICLLWIIIPTFTMKDMYGSEIPQFILLYSIGAYLRIYEKVLYKNSKVLGKYLVIISMLFLGIITILFSYISEYYQILYSITLHFYERSSLFIIISACGLFLVFKNLNIGSIKVINKIASCTFGVYLIHDNNYMRDLIWKNIFNNSNLAHSPFLIVHMISSVFIVFISCIVIEFIRQKYIERNILGLLYELSFKIENKIRRVIDKVCIL